MSDFAAGLIAGGCIILSVTFAVVEFFASASRRELIDLLTKRIGQCEEERLAD